MKLLPFLAKLTIVSTIAISTERRHDLDWLRLIAILLLLFFHTGMWFNTWDWHVKNSETSTSFNYWMIWLHFWRMPLLLFISGAGTYIAMGKRTSGQFAAERFRRLFIPLVFGMFVVVPPQIYYEHIGDYSGYWNFYTTVFNFVPYPKGSFSWHHLWFIMYLFLFSLILIPFLSFLRGPRSAAFREKLVSWLSRPAGIIFFPCLVLCVTQTLLRPFFPDETHDLTDLAFFVFYLCFFFFGMVCYSEKGIWASIGANRKKLLLAAVLVLFPFYGTYFHFRGWYKLPWPDDTVEIIFDVIGVLLSWMTVIAVIAYGQHYLNKSRPWLHLVNEGLYPFYILHQTVIIAIGYYVCQLDWPIFFKYWAIAVLTLISCLGIYLFLIRPFSPIRVLFGMKPIRRTANQADQAINQATV